MKRISLHTAILIGNRYPKRSVSSCIYGLCGCVSLLLLFAVIRQLKNRRARREIEDQHSTIVLSTMLLNREWDEAIRRIVLARLRTLEVIKQDDLDRLEGTVELLLQRSSNIDKLIAIDLADAVRVLSLRVLTAE